MKKVSVIVPIYEVEDYVEACLQSISRQTYANIEIICVNDETMDNSVTIVRDLEKRDARVQLVHHDANKGLGAARNTGMRHATGDYLKFVDSDDLLPPQAIERLVSCIEDSGADWAFADFHLMDEFGHIHGRRSPFHTSYMTATAASGLIDFAQHPLLLNEMWPSAWLALWRTEKVRRAEASFPEGSYYEDHQFFFQHGFVSGVAAYLPEPLYSYRSDRPGQITRDDSPRIYDVFTVLEALQGVFARHLSGDDLLRFSARHAVRLLAERLWVLPREGKAVDAFTRRTAAFLQRYPEGLPLACKDWYISDEDLERMLAPQGEGVGSAAP